MITLVALKYEMEVISYNLNILQVYKNMPQLNTTTIIENKWANILVHKLRKNMIENKLIIYSLL